MGYTFAIGDIHGCINPLNRLLARIETFAAEGTIVFLGDYVDRGPDSRAVLDRLIAGPGPNWRWICLQGNHEDMMVGAYAGSYERDQWLLYGGLETEMSYSAPVAPEHLHWAAARPLMHTDERRLFVHAGMVPAFPLGMQSKRDLLWLRFSSDDVDEFWGRHLVHGHTPSELNPRTVGNRTNIDGGCVFGGKLICAVFDDDQDGAPIDFIEVAAKDLYTD
jgi:serine/threonine protein phosphatase 1